MPNRELPGFDQVDAALVRQRLGVDAPELHGLMSGYLAAGGALNEDGWLAQLHVDADAGGPIEPILQTLLQVTRFALEDPDLGFELLLPDDESALAERIDHLFLWCQGFVAGFALVPKRRRWAKTPARRWKTSAASPPSASAMTIRTNRRSWKSPNSCVSRCC